MSAADCNALAVQKIAQHASARKRALQMQFVDPPHDAQVFGRDRTGLVIDRAPADVQNLRLAGNRENVRSVDHRFELSKPALVSAPSQKSFSRASSPIFAGRGRCQGNGGSSTCSATAISRAAIYAARARHSAKATERLCL